MHQSKKCKSHGARTLTVARQSPGRWPALTSPATDQNSINPWSTACSDEPSHRPEIHESTVEIHQVEIVQKLSLNKTVANCDPWHTINIEAGSHREPGKTTKNGVRPHSRYQLRYQLRYQALWPLLGSSSGIPCRGWVPPFPSRSLMLSPSTQPKPGIRTARVNRTLQPLHTLPRSDYR